MPSIIQLTNYRLITVYSIITADTPVSQSTIGTDGDPSHAIDGVSSGIWAEGYVPIYASVFS